ncbi:MAG: tetratricopeptide repeat protein [Bacteroidota bacterium]|nr:tetratricopeptide repeat protein [Bacteroidota bacterium]MDP4231593.1 tetratricopeptide repeat protein [Bacteroidota bacterium]
MKKAGSKKKKTTGDTDRLKLMAIRDPRQRIPLLNSIALASERGEVHYAIGLLREALALSQTLGLPLFLAQTNLNLSRWLGNGGLFDEAFRRLADAKSLFRKLKDKDGLMDVQLVHALILFEKQEYEEASAISAKVYDARRAIQFAGSASEPVLVSADRLGDQKVTPEKSRRNNEIKLALATRILAVAEASRMDYVKALYYLDANFELWQQLGEKQELASALSNAGTIYARIPDYASAIDFFRRSLELYKSSGDELKSVEVLSRIGDIKRKMGDYPGAFADLKEAWKEIRHLKRPELEVDLCIYFARYYIATGDFRHAYSWVEQSLETSKKRGLHSSKSQILSLAGKTFFLLQKYDEAIPMLRQGLELASRSKELEPEVRCLKYLYLCYKEMEKIDEAFRYLERFQLSESRLLQAHLASNTHAIQERFKERLEQTGDAVFRSENQELTSDVERLTEELAGLMRQVRKKDEVLVKLRKGSSSLLNYSKETQEVLKPILREVNEKLRDSDSEHDISQKLEGLQSHFMRVLRRKYPSLSKAEEKICALIHLEMSSAEIATALNISIRTVESHRLHIRRKLQLDENNTLQEVLKKI